MKRKTRSGSSCDSIVVFAGVIAVTVLTAGSTASAAVGNRQGWTTVSGEAVPSACGGVAALDLSGDLEGCWAIFPEDFTCQELNGFAWYKESGREEFDGTVHGAPGSFVTTYTFEAAFAQGFCSTFDFTAELAGGCDHYLRGTSGAAIGIVGRLNFVDVIPGITVNGGISPSPDGATHFFYVGRLNRGADR